MYTCCNLLPRASLCTVVCQLSTTVSKESCSDIPQAVNEDGVLAWTRVTVLRSFRPQLPDTRFLRMTTAAGQVRTNCKDGPHGPPENTGFLHNRVQLTISQTCKQTLQRVEPPHLSAQSCGQLS